MITATSPTRRVRWTSACLQRLPEHLPGKLRAARLLMGKALHARDVLVQDREGNRFVVPHLFEPMGQHLLVNGMYEAETRAVILERLTDDAVFVDVGANIGLFTIPAARRVRNGAVIAIEADPQLVSYLETNVTQNGLANVQVKHAAASDHRAETVRFYAAPAEKFGMGSLAPQFRGEWTGVPMQTLDDLIPPTQDAQVRVLKIDVEGFEAAVLRGATRVLTQPQPPLVVFEFMDWAEARAETVGAAQQVLRDLQFTLWRLEDWQNHRAPLDEILTQGSAMLVAEKQ